MPATPAKIVVPQDFIKSLEEAFPGKTNPSVQEVCESGDPKQISLLLNLLALQAGLSANITGCINYPTLRIGVLGQCLRFRSLFDPIIQFLELLERNLPEELVEELKEALPTAASGIADACRTSDVRHLAGYLDAVQANTRQLPSIGAALEANSMDKVDSAILKRMNELQMLLRFTAWLRQQPLESRSRP